VILQIPELLQSNSADVHDVVALRDGGFGVAARDHGAQRRHISGQRLIQGEQPHVLGEHTRDGGLGLGEVLLVCGNVLRVQRRDFEEKERDAALVASAEPLGVLRGCQM